MNALLVWPGRHGVVRAELVAEFVYVHTCTITCDGFNC